MSDSRRSDAFGFGVIAYKDRPNRCFECGVNTRGMHHVIPVVRGGTKQIPMCEKCHNLAHDCNVIQSATNKAGLEKSRANGVKFGAPVKVNEEAAEKILKIRREEGLSIKAISERVGLSVGSVHRVLKRLQAGGTVYEYINFK